ncbi:MAG: CoB--CoM heterodisulfide reductase iron-sulfur subunit A family protein [Candidatus Eisenbacteria sp.]|nr:CoB--CoM heterodisulfide reductase iron-sulfur subunit A family protein [Candidatus Eisenbacteria bacterium]
MAEPEHPRIGIFLCECAGEISSHIDLDDLALRAQACPDVMYVGTRSLWCSPDGLSALNSLIAGKQLDRVIIAGCSPRTHGILFRSQVEEVGLNWNFCQIVSLREHCARVHPGQKPAATDKANRLLRIGVAAARDAEAVEQMEVEVAPVVAVIGGGIAGMTTALSLARRGIDVKLIEQNSALGGTLRRLARLYPNHMDAGSFLAIRVKAVEANERIEVLLGTRMVSLKGHPGAFEVAAERSGGEESIPVGAVVFATGADEWIPSTDRDGSGVISLTDLLISLRKGKLPAERIVLVVSSGGPISRIPASTDLFAHSVLECVEHIRELRPGASVAVLFQDLPMTAKKAAQDLHGSGVRFIRYSPENPPRIKTGAVEVRERGTGDLLQIDTDLTVMATGLAPSEGTRQMGELPILWQDEYGFLIEPCLRLRPGEVFDRGIYVAGTAHGPANVLESMAQGFSAASRALGFIQAGKIAKRALVAVVDEEVCRGCGQCEEVCPFGAAVLTSRENNGIRRSVIDEVLCTGCGFCVSECISGAIRLPYLTDRQVRRMVAEAGS